MKYKIVKLGEDLYEISMPWWYVGSGRLVLALLEIQEFGKAVTFVSKALMRWGDEYLVCTMDKLS